MTDDERPAWPPAVFAERLQEAGERTLDAQRRMMQSFGDGSPLGPMGMGAATFKTRVQSGGRISIPDAEREALDIEEGDIVQAVVVPVKRNREESESED
jgi:hypothetical protein